MSEKVILVDQNDKEIGVEDKLKAHLGKGILHRAFACFVFNKNGELLIQKRSKEKMLWPLYWDNSCSSHPRQEESIEGSTKRRLKEELGVTCEVKNLFKFSYRSKYRNLGSEYEVCHVPVGRYDGDITLIPEEVAEWKWISLGKLEREIQENPEIFTPWFKIGFKELIKNNKAGIQNESSSR